MQAHAADADPDAIREGETEDEHFFRVRLSNLARRRGGSDLDVKDSRNLGRRARFASV
jgi:hypothetical protein